MGQVDLLADEFEVSTAYVVSSQSIAELDGVRQSVDDYLTKSDLVYWFYYDDEKRALFLKVFANMDADKAQKIFNFYFSRDMYTFRAGTFTNPDPNAGYALILDGDCTSFGKTCLIDGYKSVYPFSEAPFTLGLAGGMLDGLLGMLYSAYETSESLLTTTWSTFSSSWSYINKLRTVYARTESWLKVAETATTDARETVKSTLVAMSETDEEEKLPTGYALTQVTGLFPILRIGL